MHTVAYSFCERLAHWLYCQTHESGKGGSNAQVELHARVYSINLAVIKLDWASSRLYYMAYLISEMPK
jgi:hypothetical protein